MLARQLAAAGVRHVVVCPGSRSTPLLLAVASEPALRPLLHLDERAAGYFALGIARQSGRPVAVVCTSGTAAANLLPAAVEASLSRVPLLLLTADRPPELRDIGASQSVDQLRLFGAHARWSAELPCAPAAGEAPPELLAHARQLGARAVAEAAGPPAGAVHLNLPFREPLVAADGEAERASASAAQALTLLPPARRASLPPEPAALAALAAETAGRRGLILCGPESAGFPAPAIARLGAALGWPVLADPLSGLRTGPHAANGVIASYDAILREPAATGPLAPEVVIRFGAQPTSKALATWLARLHEAGALREWLVDEAGAWRDPGASAAMLRASPGALAEALADAVAGSPPPAAGWLAGWREADAIAGEALAASLAEIDARGEPFEGAAARALALALPEGGTLVCGNSMPVRDIDGFLPALARPLRVVGTRGAAGIDGVASTAAGAALVAAEQGAPAVGLLVGDLSFLHDLTGLWAVRRHELSLTVVLLNNDGGGIFHFLPQREELPALFEPWFADAGGARRRGGGGALRRAPRPAARGRRGDARGDRRRARPAGPHPCSSCAPIATATSSCTASCGRASAPRCARGARGARGARPPAAGG